MSRVVRGLSSFFFLGRTGKVLASRGSWLLVWLEKPMEKRKLGLPKVKPFWFNEGKGKAWTVGNGRGKTRVQLLSTKGVLGQ